ncbi:MAG: SpoIIE family protein phosphatase, partial [Clostridiales bacterium]|nr:SpoIIE family protein phosphatase [Clostridiales bacterium]
MTKQEKIKVVGNIAENAAAPAGAVIYILTLFLTGFLLGAAELPLGVYPLGIGIVCAVTKNPIAALGGALVGGILTGQSVYALSSAVALSFRLVLFFAMGGKTVIKGGIRISDHIIMKIAAAAVGGICSLAVGYIQNPDAYTLLGGIFSLSIAVGSTVAFSFLFDGNFRYTPLIPVGLISVFFGVALSLSKIEFYGFPLCLVFCIGATLLISYMYGGAHGGIAGLLLGIALGGKWMPILAFTGCVSGFFGIIGSFAAEMTSFCVFECAVIYAYGVGEWRTYLIPIVIGEALTALPAAFGAIKKVRADVSDTTCADMINKIKENENKKRMEMLSNAMMSISDIATSIAGKFRKPDKLSLEAMCRSVWRKNCESCPIDCKCHDISSIPGDDVIENLTERLMGSERITEEKMSTLIGTKCPKTDEIISQINDGAAAVFERALADSRADVCALDYKASAEMISDAMSQSGGRYDVDAALSEKLRRALLRIGFATKNLVVFGNRKTYVIATGDEILRSGVGVDDIRLTCESVCRKKFSTPSFRLENGQAAMVVESEALFCAEYAGRQCAKDKEMCNGDSVSVIENRDGYFYCFICDGMGSGNVAAATSGICSVFLEKMLACGNGKSSTLQMLNTLVRNKGVECYATVDMLEIDLICGVASFVKSGATPSYVKRGENIFKIESNTFPIGIMSELSAELTEFELKDGDVIIMCSDGVAQDFDISASLDPSWFVGFIEREWTDDLG